MVIRDVFEVVYGVLEPGGVTDLNWLKRPDRFQGQFPRPEGSAALCSAIKRGMGQSGRCGCFFFLLAPDAQGTVVSI